MQEKNLLLIRPIQEPLSLTVSLECLTQVRLSQCHMLLTQLAINLLLNLGLQGPTNGSLVLGQLRLIPLIRTRDPLPRSTNRKSRGIKNVLWGLIKDTRTSHPPARYKPTTSCLVGRHSSRCAATSAHTNQCSNDFFKSAPFQLNFLKTRSNEACPLGSRPDIDHGHRFVSFDCQQTFWPHGETILQQYSCFLKFHPFMVSRK